MSLSDNLDKTVQKARRIGNDLLHTSGLASFFDKKTGSEDRPIAQKQESQVIKKQESPLENKRDSVMIHMEDHHIKRLEQSIVAYEANFISLEERLHKQEALFASIKEALLSYETGLDTREERITTTLLDQQRAHTLELDRILLSMKSGLDKNLEKNRSEAEESMNQLRKHQSKRTGWLLGLVIFNTVCLIAYVLFDLLM